jgi:hypothetical protein
MINKWVLENHNFKICISVVNKPKEKVLEFIVMMNMRMCIQIKEQCHKENGDKIRNRVRSFGKK